MTFDTGATGEDAEGLRQAFGQIVEQADGKGGGRKGHPGDGCLEKPAID